MRKSVEAAENLKNITSFSDVKTLFDREGFFCDEINDVTDLQTELGCDKEFGSQFDKLLGGNDGKFGSKTLAVSFLYCMKELTRSNMVFTDALRVFPLDALKNNRRVGIVLQKFLSMQNIGFSESDCDGVFGKGSLAALEYRFESRTTIDEYHDKQRSYAVEAQKQIDKSVNYRAKFVGDDYFELHDNDKGNRNTRIREDIDNRVDNMETIQDVYYSYLQSETRYPSKHGRTISENYPLGVELQDFLGMIYTESAFDENPEKRLKKEYTSSRGLCQLTPVVFAELKRGVWPQHEQRIRDQLSIKYPQENNLYKRIVDATPQKRATYLADPHISSLFAISHQGIKNVLKNVGTPRKRKDIWLTVLQRDKSIIIDKCKKELSGKKISSTIAGKDQDTILESIFDRLDDNSQQGELLRDRLTSAIAYNGDFRRNGGKMAYVYGICSVLYGENIFS